LTSHGLDTPGSRSVGMKIAYVEEPLFYAHTQNTHTRLYSVQLNV